MGHAGLESVPFRVAAVLRFTEFGVISYWGVCFAQASLNGFSELSKCTLSAFTLLCVLR